MSDPQNRNALLNPAPNAVHMAPERITGDYLLPSQRCVPAAPLLYQDPVTDLSRQLTDATQTINALTQQVKEHQTTADYQQGFIHGNNAALQQLQIEMLKDPSAPYVTVGMRALVEQNASLMQQIHMIRKQGGALMECGHPSWAFGALPSEGSPDGVALGCSVCHEQSELEDGYTVRAIHEVCEMVKSVEMLTLMHGILGDRGDDLQTSRLLVQLSHAIAEKLLPEEPPAPSPDNP